MHTDVGRCDDAEPDAVAADAQDAQLDALPIMIASSRRRVNTSIAGPYSPSTRT